MSPRIIIVEGPDNCGKSTLARAIAKRYNGIYWHMTCGKGLADHDAMALYQRNAISNAIANVEQGHVVVFDRLWPSDVVYGTALRGRPSTPHEEFIEILKPYATYVFCDRANAIQEHAKAQDPDHPYDPEVYEKIHSGYVQLYQEFEPTHERVISYWLDNFIDRPGQTEAFLTGLARK